MPEATAFFIHARVHRNVPRAKACFHTHMPNATALLAEYTPVAKRSVAVTLAIIGVPIGGGTDAHFCELNREQALGLFGLDEADFRGTQFLDVPGQLKGNNDILCVTRPDIISDLHDQYFAAGADISETNTFSATTIAQEDYHLDAQACREISQALAWAGASATTSTDRGGPARIAAAASS